ASLPLRFPGFSLPGGSMRRLAILALVLVAAVLRTPAAARAEGSPIQISLFNPVQIVRADKSVSGLRIDLIYGKNAGMTGLDWGLVHHTTGSESALQYGLVGLVEKDFTGWQDNAVSL